MVEAMQGGALNKLMGLAGLLSRLEHHPYMTWLQVRALVREHTGINQ